MCQLTQFNDVPDHAHDQEPHPNRLADAKELATVGCDCQQFKPSNSRLQQCRRSCRGRPTLRAARDEAAAVLDELARELEEFFRLVHCESVMCAVGSESRSCNKMSSWVRQKLV